MSARAARYRWRMPENDGRRDFDFLFGRWRIENRRLARRLEGCTEWLEFEATGEARPALGGLANVDSFSTSAYWDGKPFEGMTVRTFNPRTRLWSIYWADDRIVELGPPVHGRFEGGHGQFFGDDSFGGRPIRVRFDWHALGADRATWEQAFSPDGEKTWEMNWRMEFTRL
jgi:hypothetical protein